MISNLLTRLWRDEAGSVLATEYLMLGGIVVLGGAAGLGEMRDSMNAEYREFGNAVRDVRQQYSLPAAQSPAASTGGTAVVNPVAPRTQLTSGRTLPVVQHEPTVVFSAP